MTGSKPVQVPNPELRWLQSLLSEVHAAQAAVPLLDGPTGSIGPGPAWTGTAALAMHDDDLAPRAKPFAAALKALDGQVQAKLNEVRANNPTVASTTAKLMIDDYEYR